MLLLISAFIWHLTLGHINKDKMQKLNRNRLLPNLKEISFGVCEPYAQRKMSRKPFNKKWQIQELLEIVHSDLCRLMRVKAHKGMKYYIIFIDDYSRCGYVYLILYKFQNFEKFKEFKKLGETQL